MAKSVITDQILLQALVERDLADKTTLEALMARQQENFRANQATIAGTAFLIHLPSRSLIVKDWPSGQEKKRITLDPEQKAVRFEADDWERWGSHALVVNPEDGNRLLEYDWETDAEYGLVSTAERAYLYNQGRLNTSHLGLSKHALFGGVYKGKPQTTPYDLYLSADQRWLCISDRGAGTVTLLDTATYEVKGQVSLREPGSVNTLNIAIDSRREKAYITDNQTSGLHVLDFNTLELSRQRLGLGILGNLTLAAGGEHFFIVSIKPNVGLHYVRIADWENEKTIKLKGDLFKADSSAPCDLLSLSPSGGYLLINTYLNDPSPFTPVISVIDTEQLKTIRRYSLKDGLKPFQLAYGFENPVQAHTRSLEELVLEAGAVGPQAMWELKRALRIQLGEDPEEEEARPMARKPEASAEEEEAESPEASDEAEAEADQPEAATEADEQFLDVEHLQVDITSTLKNNPESDTLSITPKKANHIDLPPEAVEEILDILVTTFQRQVDEDITEYEDVMQRLRMEADKARQQLEEYDSTLVQVDSLFEGLPLKTVIVREAIVIMLDLKESVKEELRLVPTNCPNCKQRLHGAWDCTVCGFELESPERAFKRRIASAEATANLPHGHIVIPDPQGLRLLQLNPYKYVSWHLDPDQLTADYPVDAIWTPNDHVLIADKDGNAVRELGLRGKLFWHFDTKLSEQHALNEPVKVTYYQPDGEGARHYLIVDQGHHRVLEVNKKSEIIREFGIMGTPGAEGSNLNLPSDVQFTHNETYLIADTGNDRVIEYDKKGGVERIFREKLGLKRPTCVQRLFNEHTLIADAGNYRLLQVDNEQNIIYEARYFTSKMPREFQVISPIKMIRLFNKDVLVMDEDKMIQVMLHTNQLVWYSMIDDLAFQPKVDAPEIVVDENGIERLVYKVVDHGEIKPVRLSQKINFKRMQKLIEARLRGEMPSDEGEDGQTLNAADKLRALIEDRKLEQKRSLRRELTMDSFQPSEVFQKPDLELKNIRHYAVDRHHNAIIRINRKGEVKWHYGFEMGQVLSRPHQLSETRRTLLVADAGNNRVVEISKADKEVIMEFKEHQDIKLGSPRCAVRLDFGRTLVADQRNKRLVEFNPRGEVSWLFDKAGQISSPQSVEELANGHILFADSMLNSIREIDRNGNLRWSYGSRIKGNGPGQLFAPEFATRLENGNTLIADTRNNRILEINMDGREVWIYQGDPVSRRKIMNPTRCQRLENGNTLITYNNQRELIEVDSHQTTIWYFKMGNDVFQPPVSSDSKGQKQMIEILDPYYNPIEKRLIKSAESKAMWGMEAHITMMENCQMKSVRASLVLMALEQSGTVVKTFPSPEELLADKFGKHMIVAFIMDPGKDPEEVAEDLRYIAEIEEAKMERILIEDPQAAVSVSA
ncbi:MAG: hypothetical protein IGS03_07005 [Candidatus Sericytochromatia bacterium]|nr:hypothetical protein [Candidatus Sericytochromatia bacterium]